MALIFITGNSGVGKSAVREELQRRGYEAHDTDENNLSSWRHKVTNKLVARPTDESERTKQWYDEHDWKISRQKVKELAKHAKNKLVFLCGSPSNADEMLDIYDQVVCLTLDKATLQHRLANRTDNDYGKAPDELKNILSWHDSFEDRYKQHGAIMIDASKPLREVVGDVLDQIAKYPKLIILSGLPFSGKSTLAKNLGDALGLRIVSYDHDIYAKHKDEVPPGTSAAKEYEIVQSKAREYLRTLLTKGESIIYDDLNLEKTDRQLLLKLARECNAKAHIIFVNTPLSVIEERRQANMQSPNRGHIGEEKMQLNISLLQAPGTDENAIYFKPGDSIEGLLRALR